ncbi:MAG TPA: HAD hydrolase family protein [Candidatus Limnocylindrales bacterium]|nr:HAD hydrolase family protein [Candidatus Limnocylindrales bacterium]
MRTPAPSFPIRLVALDLDGTLIDDALEIRPRTLAAVSGAVARGVKVSIVTGRMTTSALRFARQFGLVDPVVGYQGAIIRAMSPAGGRLGRLLLHRPLAAAAAREAILYSRSIGLSPHVNHLERFIIQSDDPGADDYSKFLGGRAVLTDDLSGWVRRPVSKVISVAETAVADGVLEATRERFAGVADVTISHPRFLEFLRPGVSKGVAVAWLARRAGVPLSAVLAIGDQFNDLEMIEGVGHGAAMPHAPGAVLAAGRYVAPPLADEGAAELIERLVLASPRDAARAADELLAQRATALAAAAALPASA